LTDSDTFTAVDISASRFVD